MPAAPEPAVAVRPATEDDTADIHRFIVALAADEEFPGAVQGTETDVHAALFGRDSVADAVIATVDGAPAGFALYYFTYSTIEGRRSLHLEDLYVRPEFRSSGLGRRMLSTLARVARNHHCARFEWWVLHSNDDARRLYDRIGAREVDEIAIMRLEGDDLEAMADDPRGSSL